MHLAPAPGDFVVNDAKCNMNYIPLPRAGFIEKMGLHCAICSGVDSIESCLIAPSHPFIYFSYFCCCFKS